MNIDAVHLYSAATYSVGADIVAEFSLDAASITQPYILQSIVGLDVDELTPQFYGTYEEDYFYNMSLKPREVVLLIKLNPQYGSAQTPSELRDEIYKAISRNRTSLVELRLMNNFSPVASITGFITKLEASLFSSETDVQLTIVCPSPLLQGTSYIQLAGTGGVTVPNPTLVDDLSTAPHGFRMELTFTAAMPSGITIQGKYGTTEWPFDIEYNFIIGDELYINSEQDHKQVMKSHGPGPVTLLGDKIAAGSVWPLMFPGTTQISLGTSNVTIDSLTYRTAYWGV